MNLRDAKNFLSVGGNFAKHLYLLKKAVLAGKWSELRKSERRKPKRTPKPP